MEQFMYVLQVFLVTASTAAQPPGSGQGSGPEVTFLPVSTATQPLIIFTPLPAASDDPHPPPSITDDIAMFSTVPLLPSSLTPSLASPLTSTLLPPSPLSLQSSEFEIFSTAPPSPVSTNIADPQNMANFDEISTQQPVLFLPPSSIEPLTSSQLLPQLTPTPTRQVLMTEALLEFPDPTSTQTRQLVTNPPLSSMKTFSELASTSDAEVIFPEFSSTRVGEIVTSLPLLLPEVTLTPAPSSAVVLNTQTIPGLTELFPSQTREVISTEAVILLPEATPSPISLATEISPDLTVVQNDTAMTSVPVMLLPLQSTPDTSIKISSTTPNLDISITEAVLIFSELTSAQTQIFVTSQSVLQMPESTPSPSHVIPSSDAVRLVPEPSPSLSNDKISLSSNALPTTFMSSGSVIISTPVMEGETSTSTSLIDFFFPPQSSTQDLSLPFTPSSQATLTSQAIPTPQVQPSSVDMLLIPLQTSELATLPISTLVISPSPVIQLLSSTQVFTDASETSDFLIVETTEVLFPMTSLQSGGVSSPTTFPSLPLSTPSLTTPTSSTETQSSVDLLTSSVPLFLLPLSSSSAVPDELTATPTSSDASRPITTLVSIFPTPLPSLLQSTTPLSSVTPTSLSGSLSQPPPSSDSDMFLIETSTLSAASSIVTIATSARGDLSTSIDLLFPFPTTVITQVTFTPSPSSSRSEVNFVPTSTPTSPSDVSTLSSSTPLQQLSTSQLAITSSESDSIVTSSESDSIVPTDSVSPIFTILFPFSSSAIEAPFISVSSTVSEQLFFLTPSPLLPLEPSPSTSTPLLSPSSIVVSSDDVMITSSAIIVTESSLLALTTQTGLLSSTSSQIFLPESPTPALSLEISMSMDIFAVQPTTSIEISSTIDISSSASPTVAVVTSTATESLVAIEPSPSLSIVTSPSSTSSEPTLSVEPTSTLILFEQPPISTSVITSESAVSSSPQTSGVSPSQQISGEAFSTEIFTPSLTSPLSSSTPLSPSASLLSSATTETVLLSITPTTSQISSLSSLQPSSTDQLVQTSSPLQTTLSLSSLSLPIQPSLTSTQLASAVQTSTITPSLSLLESPIAPSPTPSSTPSPGEPSCPSLLVEGESVLENSLVQLRLGLTTSKHSLIAMAMSPERCELEGALADAIFGNTAGRVARRQTSGIYDADITDVGVLSSGTSVITFYILNGSDPLVPPTFVSAAVVIAAIQSRNLSQVLTYPIIGIVEALPTSPTSLVVPLAAGLGVALFLLVVVAVAMVLCVAVLYYNAHKTIKVQTLRGAEAASTFARTDDFGRFSDEQSTSGGAIATVARERVAKKPPVSISQLANGWVEGGEATPTLERETPSSRQEHIPAGLFERVAHYESATPPQPSPSTRALKMKFHNAVAPSPSTSHKSHSSVDGAETVRATPTALRPHRRSGSVAREMVQSKEDDLRLQEQREEEELKQRRKATLERLMLQSRQRDTEIRSRIGSRRRKRHGSITMETTRVRPSTYGGVMPSPRWEPELDAAMGDIDSSSPFATPHPAEAMATTPRPSTRPSTKRRMARRKGNKIAPGATTDDYDSTDHAPHPYHMMMDVRGGGSMERKIMGSRGGSRMKHGRSQRGRPFSRDHGRQSTLGVSGRRSRGVAADVQRELAWMDTPGGVQLMRIQPILPAAAVAAPTFALPPHPSTAGGQLISVQPRPHPKALTTPPHPRHSTLENLPTLAPPQQPSQNFTHKQLETLWREIEKFQLDQTMRRDSTATGQAPPNKAMPTEQPKPKETAKSTDAQQVTATSEVGEAGEAGEAVSSGDVKPKDKDKKVDASPQEQSTATASAQASSSHATMEHPPATPAPPTQLPQVPDIDSSYSSAAAIQELLQQAFSASQSQGGGGVGQPWAASSTYQDSMDSGTHLLRLSGGASYQPPSTAWHSVVSSQPPQQLAPPTQIYAAPPTHYSGLPGQLVWAPPDPHSFAPLHTQVISPAQLTQLRQQSSQPTSYDYDVGYSNDPYHTPPAAPRPPTQQYFSPYSRYRRHDPFS